MDIMFPPPGLRILALSGALVALNGSTIETALATYTLPGNTMGPNDALLFLPFWSFTNGADDKTLKVRAGGIGGTAISSNLLTTNQILQTFVLWRAANSMTSQKGFNAGSQSGLGASTGGVTTTTLNMANDQDFVFTGQLENGADTLNLQGYLIALLKGP